MQHRDRSDAELLELAQAGWAPAFAVLLHRHGAAVRGAVDTDPDPAGAVIETYVAAMRALPTRDLDAPVRPWLLALAGVDPAAPPPERTLTEDELDEVWAELAVRWPSGRVPRHRDGWRRAGLVAGLALLAGLVPALILAAGSQELGPIEELRAHPVEGDVPLVAPPVEEDPGPLPTYEFPSVPEDEPPAPAPSPTETPAATPTVEPTVEPAPTPTATTPEPEPTEIEPRPEPTESEPDPEPTPSEPTEPPEDPGGGLLPPPGGDR